MSTNQPFYHLVIESGSFNCLSIHLASASYSQVVLLSHPSLINLYGTPIKEQLNQLGWPVTSIFIPEGEKSKSLRQVTRCWQQMFAKQIDRQAVVIALGGGVICDIAGFVAACYMRGIDTIYLPTSFMAMVDAALGGKTGVNLAHYKNGIGSFHHPKWIFIDPQCLKTLSQRELSAGLAEVIKYGMVADSGLFEELENQMEKILQREEVLLERLIRQACSIKNGIVQSDYRDMNNRAHLNYGHTFGHALEALTHYRSYLHGEAVSIGMSCAAHLSCYLGLTQQTTLMRQDALCKRANLPTHLPSNLCLDRLIEAMKSDKKAKAHKINLILPEKIGKVIKVFDVDPMLIKQALLTKV